MNAGSSVTEKTEKDVRPRLALKKEREGLRGRQPTPPVGPIRQGGVPWLQPPMATTLTWVVPASSCRGASPPVPVHLGEFPLLVGVTGEGVRGQVADLQARIVPQEVTEGHPGKAETVCPELQKTRSRPWPSTCSDEVPCETQGWALEPQTQEAPNLVL